MKTTGQIEQNKNTNKSKSDFIDSLSELFSEIFQTPIQFVKINPSEVAENAYTGECVGYGEVDAEMFRACEKPCCECEFADECEEYHSDEDEDLTAEDLKAILELLSDEELPAINTIERLLTPTRVIINGGATIIFWQDGSKTVVKCHKEDKFDAEKGVAMALLKKVYGNTGKFNSVIAKCLKMTMPDKEVVVNEH